MGHIKTPAPLPDQSFYRTLLEAARKTHPDRRQPEDDAFDRALLDAARKAHPDQTAAPAQQTTTADDPALARALHAYARAISDQPGDHEAALRAAIGAARHTRRVSPSKAQRERTELALGMRIERAVWQARTLELREQLSAQGHTEAAEMVGKLDMLTALDAAQKEAW